MEGISTLRAISWSMILLGALISAGVASEGATTTTTSEDVAINLTAKDFAFNASTITVPAGAKVTIYFDNMDSGVEHNFAVYETSEAEKPIFVGDEITGPEKITYIFTAPSKAGKYFFRCDDHPGQMKGDFIVK